MEYLCSYFTDLSTFKVRVCLVLSQRKWEFITLLDTPQSLQQTLCFGRRSLFCLCPSAGQHLQSENCSFWLSLKGRKSSHRLCTCSQEMDSIALSIQHGLNEGEGTMCKADFQIFWRYSVPLPAQTMSLFPVTRR